MYKLYLEKAEETGDQIANIFGSYKKKGNSKKTSTSASLTTLKSDCVDHSRLWKILKEMEIPDHLTGLLGNLYAGQEATVRTGHGTMDWFKIRKGVHQGCILSSCLFNICRVHHVNARLDDSQAGIKTAGRNISNLS